MLYCPVKIHRQPVRERKSGQRGRDLHNIINLGLARAPCEGQSKFWDIIKLQFKNLK